MSTYQRRGLTLGIIIASVAPLAATTNVRQPDEPWPSLLASDAGHAEPEVAQLQWRARATLENLIEFSRVSSKPL